MARYSEYTVYVKEGEAEDKFREFMSSLRDAAETSWQDWHEE
jgi:hypothetical protein